MVSEIYFSQHMQFILPILSTISIAMLWLLLFRKRSILDKPGPDIVPKRSPVPTMQWLFVFIAICVWFLVWFPQYIQHPIVQWLLAGCIILLAISARDERRYIRGQSDIPAWIRVLVQIWAILVALYVGNIWIPEWTFQGMIITIPKIIFALFFVCRSLLCINAINRFDGVYGQASGVSSIGFLTTMLLIQFVVLPYYGEISIGHETILLLVRDMSYVLFVVSLVYTIIEYKPRWLVRDLGTMIFGFTLAYLSIVWWVKIGTIIVALSLVIFDALRVWVHRLCVLRKSPLQWDYTHLHFRLLGLGRSRGEVRAFVRWRGLFMMVIMILQDTDRADKFIIFIALAVIFFAINGYLFWIKKLPCGLHIKK